MSYPVLLMTSGLISNASGSTVFSLVFFSKSILAVIHQLEHGYINFMSTVSRSNKLPGIYLRFICD